MIVCDFKVFCVPQFLQDLWLMCPRYRHHDAGSCMLKQLCLSDNSRTQNKMPFLSFLHIDSDPHLSRD